ncbi:MAG: M20/M25/M40 family metallo-hydrolase [Planctomycetota bacterium]|jgi:hypothetical protein
MRLRIGLLLGFLLCIPVFAQDAQDEVEERIRKRVDEVLEKSNEWLLEELSRTIREELAEALKASDPLEEPLQSVTAALLRSHVTYLAGDALKGRRAGTTGAGKAALRIAKVFKDAGLKPVGDAGTYAQQFVVKGRRMKNILGLLEGTDPELKKQVVVVGAHYDHLGGADDKHWNRLGDALGGDTIWNGADDNASGVAAVLAVAQALGGVRTKRSILFAAFTGEEDGLYGSKHYVAHPAAPIGEHVFMLNLDMIGRNPKRPVEIRGGGSDRSGVVREAVLESVRETGLKVNIKEPLSMLGSGSDHTPFREKGVPVVMFFTGFHPDYHRVTDHADKIAYDRLAVIAQTVGRVLHRVAEAGERPEFSGRRPAPEVPEIPERIEPKRRLGITATEVGAWELRLLDLGENDGAARINGVARGSVAEKAGVKKGDIIISIGGKPLSREDTLESVRERCRDVEPDVPVKIVVVRSGEKVTLEAVWDK